MKKGWIVTKDHLDNREVTVIGPRGCSLTEDELRKGHPFKMFDDDGELYYTGFLVGDKDSEEGLMPLDHYWTPNAGCTYIQYKTKNGKWETL